MELLKSEKLELPIVYFITNKDKIKDVPIGIPFIFGDESIKNHMIKLLEYEILYQAAVATGYPFNFKEILKDNGYKDLTEYYYSNPAYIEYSTTDSKKSDFDFSKCIPISSKDSSEFRKFTDDISAYVDIQVLKNLNVFPTWLNKIEDAIHTNIHNFAIHNPNMYNKKLEGMYGGIDLKPPCKNLIIIDISGSIPKAVSTTCLTLAKNLAETFYSDLLITGSKSTLYSYEELLDLSVESVYKDNGMDNDQIWFEKIVSSDNRSYNTAIVFGDNHHPGMSWGNDYNKGSRRISDKDGKEICKWNITKVISFHTSNDSRYDNKDIAGYARWFSPDLVEHIDDWVKYLK